LVCVGLALVLFCCVVPTGGAATSPVTDEGVLHSESQSNASVSLAPTAETIGPAETTSYDIVVTGATDGISAYSLTVQLDNPAVASIEGYSSPRDPPFNNTEVGNNSVSLSAAMGTSPIPGDTQITLGTLSVGGTAPGTTAVSIVGGATGADLSDGTNTPYSITGTTNATLTTDWPTASLSLAPSSQDASVGETLTYDVVADGLTQGLTAYEFVIQIPLGSGLTITEFTHALPLTENQTQHNGNFAVVDAVVNSSAYSSTTQVTLGSLTVSVDQPGTHSLQIRPQSVAITSNSSDPVEYQLGALSNASAEVSRQPATVTVSGPQSVQPGTVTLNITASGTTQGIDAYDMTVTTSGPPAQITEYTLFAEGTVFDNSEIVTNSTLALTVALGNATYPPTPTATLASFTLSLSQPGDLSIQLTNPQIATAGGNIQYNVTSTNQSLSVISQPPALPGAAGPPQDLDDDGLYEDVTGNGEFTIFDVQALFVHRNTPAVVNHPHAFSFNQGDFSTVTIFDIQELFTLV
jgi:hypothetical protein